MFKMKLPFEEREYSVIMKQEAKSASEYGCAPEKRSIEELLRYGVVNIDKPKGPTSHQVSDYVKKILHISKAGHSGTLDPGVTGVLPVAIEDATRIVQALLPAGKEYICVMHLHKDIEEDTLRKELQNWQGIIHQKPPIKSSVRRIVRERTIYYLDILEIKEKDVLFRIGCQAGTYIRKFCHDVGLKLGGAHMAELRRTKAGPFAETTLCTLQDLTDALHYYQKGDDHKIRQIIQPIESAVAHLPKVVVFDSTINSLTHGRNLALPGIAQYDSDIKEGDMIAVLSLKGELVCLGTSLLSATQMKQEKGVAVNVERVFMKTSTYPRITS